MTGMHDELLDYLTKNDIQSRDQVHQQVQHQKHQALHNGQEGRGKDIKGVGLAILVHDSIPFQKVDSPATLTANKLIEELTISITNH